MHGIRVGSHVKLPPYADHPDDAVFEVLEFKKPRRGTGMEATLLDMQDGSFVIWDIDELTPCPKDGIKSLPDAPL